MTELMVLTSDKHIVMSQRKRRTVDEKGVRMGYPDATLFFFCCFSGIGCRQLSIKSLILMKSRCHNAIKVFSFSN